MKFKNFIKENYKFLLLILFIALFFNLKLPFYIMAPGGTINVTGRVEMENYKKDTSGSLNMLYVSEYEATPATLVMSKLKDYDIEKKKERQISNEKEEEIHKRNIIMRDNSLDIATMVAYQKAGKKINIKDQKNIVVGTTSDNGLKVGDIITLVDGNKCKYVDDIKNIITSKEVGEKITFNIVRDGKEKTVESKILLENNTKVIGVVIITEYDYDIDPEVNIKFKSSESGSSGGLMLALTIYNAISDEDIIKGRDIAGTGTISYDGSVGVIDGVKYKIMGAASNDIKIVFVPSDNYEEAINTKNKYHYDMEIIKVDTFDDAITYLRNN